MKISEITDKGFLERRSQETLKDDENISKCIPGDIDKSIIANRKHSREKQKKCKMCAKRIILTFVALDILIVNIMLIWMYIPFAKYSKRSKANDQASKANMLLYVNKNTTTFAHDVYIHWTFHSAASQNGNIEYKGNKIILHQDGVYAITLDLSLNTNFDKSNKSTHGINICLTASDTHIGCDRKTVNVGWMGKARIHLVGKPLSKGTELAVTIDHKVKTFIREDRVLSYFYIMQL